MAGKTSMKKMAIGEDGFRDALGGAEAEGVVVFVDEFERGG
jgi:hypothetical protein